MESERRRKLTRRNPLSDCSITSSSSVPLKSTKLKPSYFSPVFKNLSTKFNSSTNAVAVNLDDPSYPNSSPSTFLSTPLTKSSIPAFEKISVVYRKRNSSNRKDREKEVVIPTSSVPIKAKDKGKDVVDFANSAPVKRKEKDVVVFANSAPVKRKDNGKDTFFDTWKEAVISASSTSIKRKDKWKECDIPSNTTSNSRVSNTREKSDGLERTNPPKAKAFSVPCTKKNCAESSTKDVFNDRADIQDFIKKQNAYFKMIDEFELLEEVESISDS